MPRDPAPSSGSDTIYRGRGGHSPPPASKSREGRAIPTTGLNYVGRQKERQGKYHPQENCQGFMFITFIYSDLTQKEGTFIQARIQDFSQGGARFFRNKTFFRNQERNSGKKVQNSLSIKIARSAIKCIACAAREKFLPPLGRFSQVFVPHFVLFVLHPASR